MSFYTAGCGKKMPVSVTGPRAANECQILNIKYNLVLVTWKVNAP